jgi:hypothetical protein
MTVGIRRFAAAEPATAADSLETKSKPFKISGEPRPLNRRDLARLTMPGPRRRAFDASAASEVA